MAENRGKKFEHQIESDFKKVKDISIDRLHDQMSGYLSSTNICDYIIYKKPNIFYIECKSVHGNTLSLHGNDKKHKYGNITNAQWEGLLEKSKIEGAHAGIICWFIDRDVTYYIPIEVLESIRINGGKSINYQGMSIVDSKLKMNFLPYIVEIKGKKKRVFFSYDMSSFLKEVLNGD